MFIAVCLLAVLELQYPSTFDLRDVGGQSYVTSVKSQQGGTCWTHGTMASIESNMLLTGEWENQGEAGEPNLAEYHLDWWNGFNNWHNYDMDPPIGSGGLSVHEGGDYLVTTAYLSRGSGTVRDIDGQSFGTAPRLNSPDYHYYYPADVEWYVGGDDLESLNGIKSALMQHGALATCYYASSSYMQNYIHYQPPYEDELPNHSVAIIGWDDNMITQAPEPGAWICKNSWGEGWGFDGFFYISYWDKWCGREPFMGAVSFTNAERMEYEQFYYHDYHGWRDTFEGATRVMNAFEATGSHYITAVSFFTADDSVGCDASLYGSFAGGTLQDLLSSQDAYCQVRGFHTVQLDQPFQVLQGDSVYLEMEFSRGGYPYDRTADVPVLLGSSARVIVESAASAGESYYYDGSWQDFYGCPDNPYPETGNFCVKMLGFNAGLRVTPGDDAVFQGVEGGPFTPSGNVWVLQFMGDGSAQYQVSAESASWLTLLGPLSGTITPGQNIQITAALSSEALSLSQGVYTADVSFVNTSGGTGGGTSRVVLVVGETGVVYGWNMDSNPGWTAQGDWQWGIPQGFGGAHGNHDPSGGYTGQNVYGYNLWGDYEPGMQAENLTTSALDCSGLTGTQLRFRRWLGVQDGSGDNALVQVSTDQSTWHTVWENGSVETDDLDWNLMVYDISQYADGQPQVWGRWGMGPSDSQWEYCGWNLDDVEVWAIGAYSVESGEPAEAFGIGFAGCNPAVTSTTFRCSLPASGMLTVEVYDISGRMVGTVYNGNAPTGDLNIPFSLTDFSGNRLPAGIYPVVARSGGMTAVTRLVVLGN